MGLIRIILALAVLISHLEVLNGNLLIPGNIAVELFFIISGYYMAMVIKSGAYNKGLKINSISFYKSRFFRLYPTFITITIGSFVYYYFVWWMLGKEPKNSTDQIYDISDFWLKIPAFLSNVSMIGQDLFSLFHILPNGDIKPFYSKTAGVTQDGAIWLGSLRIIGQAWSIGTEIWFYLLVPILTRLKIGYLLGIAILSFVLKMYFEIYLGFETYFFFPCQLYLFILGMLAFYLNEERKHHNNSPFVLLGLVIVSLFIYPLFPNIYFQSSLYLFFFIAIDSCFKLTKNNKIDRLVGNLSYPVYLVHILMIGFLHNFFNYIGVENNFLLVILSVLLSLISSSLLLYFVEIPFDKFRIKYKNNFQ